MLAGTFFVRLFTAEVWSLPQINNKLSSRHLFMFDSQFVFHTCKSFSVYNSADVFASHNYNVV